VIAVGPGRVDRDTLIPVNDDIRPGAIVMFGKYAGTEVKIDGRDVLLVRETEILAVRT
jgi:chaperonin GroES